MKKVFALFLLVPFFLYAADATKPHNHTGIVKPYTGEPPQVTLSKEELTQINSGKPVYKQTDEGSSGKAVAVFKVAAPQKTIWKILSDIEAYPKWISNLSEAKVYKREGNKIFAQFTIKVWPTTTTYFIEHTFPLDHVGYGTWKLDYSRLSDLDESIGFWRVAPEEGNPQESIVYYSVDVHVRGFLSLIKGFIVDKGLKEATQWVKLAAETMVAQEKENIGHVNKTASNNPTEDQKKEIANQGAETASKTTVENPKKTGI